jgi:hypothetical protein
MEAAFITYYTIKEGGAELDPKKLHCWGKLYCSRLNLATLGGGETPPTRALLGVWETAGCGGRTTMAMKKRMTASLKRWGGFQFTSTSSLTLEKYTQTLHGATHSVSAMPEKTDRGSKRKTKPCVPRASSANKKVKASAAVSSTSGKEAGEKATLDIPNPEEVTDNATFESTEEAPGVPEVPEAPEDAPGEAPDEAPDEAPREAHADPKAPVTIGSVAATLKSLKPAIAIVSADGPLLPLHSIIEALRFMTPTKGKDLWGYATRKMVGLDAIPPTYPVKVSGKHTNGLRPCDLTKALTLAIPEEELYDLMAEADIIQALKDLVIKSHQIAMSSTGEEESSVDELVAALEKKRNKDVNLLLEVQLPELIAGAGPLICRVCRANDGVTLLGSVHDFLKWLQVDKDGKHSDWNSWLFEALARDMQNHLAPSRDDFAGEPQPVLEHYEFKGKKTPMGNVGAFRILTRLCCHKSPVASSVVDEALKQWTKKLTGSPGLPEAARGFLDPENGGRRDEGSVVATGFHTTRLQDAEYSDALACYKRKEHDWQLAVVRDEAEYAQKSQRDEAEYAQKSQRDEAEYAQKSQRDAADDTEKRQLNMEQYKREMEQKKREMEQKKQKQQLEMKEIQAAHDNRCDILRIESEEKTRCFQFKKSKFNTEVRLSIAEGTFSQEEGDQMMGKQRKRLFLSLGELMIREGLAGVKETTKFGQRFKQAYMDGFFSPKPLTDWVNGLPDVQNGQVTWYDEDLPKMREKAKQLIAEKAAEKAVASRGQSTLKVVARKVCLGGSPDSSVPSV